MSVFLDDILKNQRNATNMQIVFVDIVNYSKRKTRHQISVINNFIECVRNSITGISKTFIEHSQTNNMNFLKDIIYIPTGDGVAIVFPFSELHDIHFRFAIELLFQIYSGNNKSNCIIFNDSKWCNCHNHFFVRIGISEGKCILYKDINNNYNIVGNPINIASRLSGIADYNQIIFSEDAYRQIIDLDDNPEIANSFHEYKSIKIKHGEYINAYQFIDGSFEYINVSPSLNLIHLIDDNNIESGVAEYDELIGNMKQSKLIYDELVKYTKDIEENITGMQGIVYSIVAEIDSQFSSIRKVNKSFEITCRNAEMSAKNSESINNVIINSKNDIIEGINTIQETIKEINETTNIIKHSYTTADITTDTENLINQSKLSTDEVKRLLVSIGNMNKSKNNFNNNSDNLESVIADFDNILALITDNEKIFEEQSGLIEIMKEEVLKISGRTQNTLCAIQESSACLQMLAEYAKMLLELLQN